MGSNFWSVIWFTTWQSSLTTLLAVLLGGGLAVLERHYRVTAPRWFILICSAILFLPPIIIATSFIMVFGHHSWWYQLTQLQLLYRPGIVILAHLYYNIPLAYLLIQSKLRSLPPSTEDAAMVMGAMPQDLAKTVWWPEIKSTVFGSAVIIFLYCWTSFAIPLQLGGSHAKTIEVWLYQTIVLYHDYALAGLIVLLQTLVGLISISWIVRSHFYQPILNFPPRTQSLPIHWYGVYSLLGTIIVLPLLSFISRTLLTTQWDTIQQLWHSHFFQRLGWTILLSVIVMIVTVVISLLIKQQLVLSLGWLAISPVSLGFIWMLVWGQGTISLLVALILSLLPISHFFIAQRLQQQPRYLLDTAVVLGANQWQRYRLQWQWLRPTIQRVSALGVVVVLGDITLSGLLAPSNQPTAMVTAYALLAGYRFQMASLAMLIILITIISLQAIIYAKHRPT